MCMAGHIYIYAIIRCYHNAACACAEARQTYMHEGTYLPMKAMATAGKRARRNSCRTAIVCVCVCLGRRSSCACVYVGMYGQELDFVCVSNNQCLRDGRWGGKGNVWRREVVVVVSLLFFSSTVPAAISSIYGESMSRRMREHTSSSRGREQEKGSSFLLLLLLHSHHHTEAKQNTTFLSCAVCRERISTHTRGDKDMPFNIIMCA